jgi:hypothetical protein
MSMSSAAEILVIILSVFLSFFLLLAIILIIYWIALTRQIRRVAQSAERTADSIESAVTKMSRVTSPILFARMIAKIVKKFRSSMKGDNDVKE